MVSVRKCLVLRPREYWTFNFCRVFQSFDCKDRRNGLNFRALKLQINYKDFANARTFWAQTMPVANRDTVVCWGKYRK